MAARRAFDHDKLRQLVYEHPDWTHNQYARVLTDMARADNPNAPPVNPGSVGGVISRNRDNIWPEQGYRVREVPQTIYSEWIWFQTAPEYKMNNIMRKLRAIARIRNGVPVRDRSLVTAAPAFEQNLRAMRQVVDVTEDGKPYVRDARPDELGEDGELIEIVARKPEGYRPNRIGVRPVEPSGTRLGS